MALTPSPQHFSPLYTHSCREPSPCIRATLNVHFQPWVELHSCTISCLWYISIWKSIQPPSDPILNSSYSPPNQIILPVSLFLLTAQPTGSYWRKWGCLWTRLNLKGGHGISSQTSCPVQEVIDSQKAVQEVKQRPTGARSGRSVQMKRAIQWQSKSRLGTWWSRGWVATDQGSHRMAPMGSPVIYRLKQLLLNIQELSTGMTLLQTIENRACRSGYFNLKHSSFMQICIIAFNGTYELSMLVDGTGEEGLIQLKTVNQNYRSDDA